jgi:hypothetical protein
LYQLVIGSDQRVPTSWDLNHGIDTGTCLVVFHLSSIIC